jgi:hypothetical protein
MSKQLAGPALVFTLAASVWLAGDAVGLQLRPGGHGLEPRSVVICPHGVVLTRATEPLGRMADCAATAPRAFGIRRVNRIVTG